MPRYFLHLIDHTDMTLGPEGTEMPAEAVAAKALWSARDCMAGDVKDGRLDLRYRIDVHDEVGELVHTLPFKHAVNVVPEQATASEKQPS